MPLRVREKNDVFTANPGDIAAISFVDAGTPTM